MVEHPRGRSRVWLWSVMAVMITLIRDWQGLHYNTNVRLGSEELDWQKTNSGYCDWETQRVCRRDIWFSRIWLWSGKAVTITGIRDWHSDKVHKCETWLRRAWLPQTKLWLLWPRGSKSLRDIWLSRVWLWSVMAESWLPGSGTSDKVCVRD